MISVFLKNSTLLIEKILHIIAIFERNFESKRAFLRANTILRRGGTLDQGVKGVAPISISLACGPHTCAITVNAAVGGWLFGGGGGEIMKKFPF